MKSSRRVMWAGVEVQPDLQNPTKPVRLGVVLVSAGGPSDSSFVILGRQPLLDPKPPEFNEVGPTTFELAARWVDNMSKDISEAADAVDSLTRLLERWRWNLYLIQPAKIGRAAEQQDLLVLAKRMYEKFVGEPFRFSVASRRPRRTARQQRHTAMGASALPAAWLVEEITRRRSSPELAATA